MLLDSNHRWQYTQFDFVESNITLFSNKVLSERQPNILNKTNTIKNIKHFSKKGDFLIKASSGVTLNGKPYSGGEVELSTTIYDTKDGIKTYWMEELDANGNPIKTSVFTPKNIMIGLAVIIVLGLIIKK